MQLLFIVSLFCCLISEIACNAYSVPVEAVLAYYAYQAEVLHKGVGNTDAVPHLRGSMPDGSATFDELMREIFAVKGRPTTYNIRSLAGNDRIPDWDRVSNDLHSQQWRSTINSQVLYPRIFTSTPNYQMITSQYEKHLTEAANAKPDSADIKNLLTNAGKASEFAHMARLADGASFVNTAVEQELQKINPRYTVVTRQRTVGYLAFQDVDVDATFTHNGITSSADKTRAETALKSLWDTYAHPVPRNSADKAARAAFTHLVAQRVAMETALRLQELSYPRC